MILLKYCGNTYLGTKQGEVTSLCGLQMRQQITFSQEVSYKEEGVVRKDTTLMISIRDRIYRLKERKAVI